MIDPDHPAVGVMLWHEGQYHYGELRSEAGRIRTALNGGNA